MFQRRYPQGSIVPLLYPTIFPAIGIVPSVVRKRTLDAIAAVAMRGLVIHIVVTIPVRSAGVRACRSSFRLCDHRVGPDRVCLDRPFDPSYGRDYGRQEAMDAGKLEHQPSFDRLVETQGKCAFFTISVVWGVCVVVMSGLHILLALKIPSAEFPLVSLILGVLTIAALLIWTGRYLEVRTRLSSNRFE